MPCRTEAALLAVGIIGDDVNCRNLRLLVDWDVVVGNHATITLREVRAITCLASRRPYLLDDRRSILLRHALTIEFGSLSSYHVEEDAIAREITIRLVLAPILSTQCPRISTVLNVRPLRCSPVLCIKADEIDPDARIEFLVYLQLAGDFQHHGDTTRSIVGRHHRLVPVGAIWVVVSPRTTVPVGTQHNASRSLRIVVGDDVGVLQYRSIISLQVSLLSFHLAAELLKLLHNPLATLIMCLAIHRARTEIALRLTECQG